MGFKYTVNGETVELQERTDKVAVRYREPALHSHRAAIAGSVSADFKGRFEIPGEKYTVLPAALDGGALNVDSGAGVALAQSSDVARAAPVFRHGQTDLVATDRVLVGLTDESAPIEPLLAKFRKLEVKPRGYGEYAVRLAEDVDPLAVASELATTPGVRYAEPDFVHIGPGPARPGEGRVGLPRAASADADTAAAALDISQLQYAMRTTRAVDAWGLAQAQSGVRVAILDEGVDTDHKDLKASVVGGYDSIDGDEFQEPSPWNGHGTACAGLAVAFPVGVTGVRGIAGGCSLLAVRIARSMFSGAPWVWSTEGVANAIDWAWREGRADVLSNSWTSAPTNSVASALARALSMGRDGKGCVVVVAAGNHSGAVQFPGTIEGVLTVSACNDKDEFKTTSSSDGETFWGSNFGPQIGIAAPGVRNFTTDISADGGYDAADYYAAFSGTSSATPLVAGAAALVLSVRPDLTGQAARQILCSAADQVGSEPYVDGRNDQFGYGRLNVLKAIQATQA